MSKAAYYNELQRPFLKRLLGPGVVVFIMFYLIFHAISGERGLFALFTETRRLDELKIELADVRAKREALETKAHRLSDTSLDLDLLDEQARQVLGMAGKNEVVYFLNDKTAAQP